MHLPVICPSIQFRKHSSDQYVTVYLQFSSVSEKSVKNQCNEFQRLVSVIDKPVQLSVIAYCGITGEDSDRSTIVIIDSAAAKKIENFVIPDVGMLTDGAAGCENHVVEKPAFSVQLLNTIENFMHLHLTVAVSNAFKFYGLLIFRS